MTLRLFVGITAPQVWKDAITDWRRKAQPRFSDSFGRWTSEANLHLTLRFFGGVEEQKVGAIGEALQRVAAQTKAFAVLPGALGCFPSAARPRIVWLGLEGAAALVELESRVRSATANFGQAPEERPFHPHLTLIRVNDPRRQDRDALAQLIQDGNPIDVPPWPVKELELIRSELKPGGSVYSRLATFPLA